MADAPILVPATLPATPLVLADAKFLVELALVESTVASLSIADAHGAQSAADLLRKLTTVGGSLEKTRADLKKPFLDIGRKIDDVAKLVDQRIERSKGSLRRLLTDWNTKEQARIAEENRKRQAELEALERQRQAEAEVERQRVATLAASTPPADVIDFDFSDSAPAPKSATEKRIEQLAFTPAPVAAKPSGISFRQTLKFSVVSVASLPEEFKVTVANEQAIRQAFCVGWKADSVVPVVPGLVFSVHHDSVSTGRAS